jgi:hypothetical protein
MEVLLERNTENGHGVVHAIIIATSGGRFTTVFLSSRGDEVPGQRQKIEELIATFKVE